MFIHKFDDNHEEEKKDFLSDKGRENFAEDINGFREPTQKIFNDLIDVGFDRLIKRIRRST